MRPSLLLAFARDAKWLGAGQVTFRWRDRAHGNAIRVLALPVEKESVDAFAMRVLGLDIRLCPVCHEGRMRLVRNMPRERGPPDHA